MRQKVTRGEKGVREPRPTEEAQYAVPRPGFPKWSDFWDAICLKLEIRTGSGLLDVCQAIDKLRGAAVASTEETVVTLARELYDRFVMGGWEPQDAHGRIREILGMAAVPSTPSAQWISPRKDLPDEDELVLVAVTCEEGDDNDEVTQRWEEVHEATMYRGGCDLIAATADGNEYMNEEILGWMPLPAPPSGDRATQVQKEDTCTQDTRIGNDACAAAAPVGASGLPDSSPKNCPKCHQSVEGEHECYESVLNQKPSGDRTGNPTPSQVRKSTDQFEQVEDHGRIAFSACAAVWNRSDGTHVALCAPTVEELEGAWEAIVSRALDRERVQKVLIISAPIASPSEPPQGEHKELCSTK